MKHFNLIYDTVKYGEGVELENGGVLVEFDYDSAQQFSNMTQLTDKYYAYTIEWVKVVADDQLSELTKLMQQFLLSMSNTSTILANALKTIGVKGSDAKWLTAESHDTFIKKENNAS